jgi:hypothetical protein
MQTRQTLKSNLALILRFKIDLKFNCRQCLFEFARIDFLGLD